MDRNILAGMFARTNMGQSLDPLWVEQALQAPPTSATEAAYHFCADLMEDETIEDAFVEEAEGWHEQLSKMSDEEITATWPQTVVVYRAAASKYEEAGDAV